MGVATHSQNPDNLTTAGKRFLHFGPGMEGPGEASRAHAASRLSHRELTIKIVDRRRPRLRTRNCASATPTHSAPGYKESSAQEKSLPTRHAIPSRSTNQTPQSIHNLWCAARERLRCSKGQPELPGTLSFLDPTKIAGAPSFAPLVLRRVGFDILSLTAF
jgi:hypothetical protein